MDELRIVTKKNRAVIPALVQPTTNLKINLTESFRTDYFLPKYYSLILEKTINGHDSDILCLAYDKGKIISGSHDKTIKIWDLETSTLLNTLEGHNAPVHAISISNNQIFSASADRTIKIWDLATGKLKCTLLGHNNHVYSVLAIEDKFISTALDKTIKIWDTETKKLLKVITTGEHSAWAIALKDNFLVAGLSDGTLRIYDFETGTLKFSTKEHEDSITSVVIYENRIISASKDRSIKVWDLNNLDLIHTFKGHLSPIWYIYFDNYAKKVMSCSEDKTIRIWDTVNGDFVDSINAHKDWVCYLTGELNTVISSSGDKHIKIWQKKPKNDCNSINLTRVELQKSPFETKEEFQLRVKQDEKEFFEKLVSYDYINIGKVEIMEEDYLYSENILPIELLVTCDKIAKLSNLPKNSLSKINIPKYEAEKIYLNLNLQDLYIKYFVEEEQLHYELVITSGYLKYNIDLDLKNIVPTQKQKIDLKTGRLKIDRFKTKNFKEECLEKPIHDCKSIDTKDTFRQPFETMENFEKRVKDKFISYN